MNKILITIFVPRIEEHYDVKIPINAQVKELIELLQKAISDMTDKVYEINPNAMLYDKITGKIINYNNIVKYSGLKNGSSVMLF